MKNKRLVVCNWKMNPETVKEATALFQVTKKHAARLRNVETIVCPPAVFLSPLAKIQSGHRVTLGAQDVFAGDVGAETGMVSAPMIASVGVRAVIVGHSEMHARGETDESVNAKVLAVLKEKMTPIICVGEKHRDHDHKYLGVIKDQITKALVGIPKSAIAKIIVAYEPVWAIGVHAPRPATSEEVREMVLFIRKTIADISDRKIAQAVRILYGASVDGTDASGFLNDAGVNGLLVGRASLKEKTLVPILKATDTL